MIEISVATKAQVEMVDITASVRRAIAESGVKNGLAVIFVPHTTAAVTINENADPDVVRDMVMELGKIVPFDDNYHHGEGNSAAHIKTSLIGSSETVPVVQGEPRLGTWQGIYFCEFDGPRRRRFTVQVIGQ